MKDKLEPNMYVRTKITDNCNCVYIRKIDEIDERPVFQNQICIDEDVIDGWGDDRILIDEEDISKSSHNIIDLIEVGDYVNGYYVEDVLKTFVNVAVGSNYFQSPTIYEKDIKSIVTKESMESITYYVK